MRHSWAIALIVLGVVVMPQALGVMLTAVPSEWEGGLVAALAVSMAALIIGVVWIVRERRA